MVEVNDNQYEKVEIQSVKWVGIRGFNGHHIYVIKTKHVEKNEKCEVSRRYS